MPRPAIDRRRGRLVALALFVIAAIPVLAAFAANFVWPPQRTLNYGELIGPVALPDVPAIGPGEKPLALSSLRGKWLLVSLGSGLCDERCAERHFLMRQVRLMQGREAGRVERLWLILDGAEADAGALRGHEGMRVARVPASFAAWFPAADDAREHLYLVDPQGRLMLRFPRQPDARGMHRDLARLLKVSHTG